MALTIQTNIVSLNAQRQLGLSGRGLATAMQRLSSGLRVNSAKDDAAGLSISERMRAGVRGLSVAQRNASDGISLMQTAEASLGKMSSLLQRMRELSVQSANTTNSASDRQALQTELSQLRAELDRLGKNTQFNGQHLLNGRFAGAVFQVGASAGQNVSVGQLVHATAEVLGASHWGERALPVVLSHISNLEAVPYGTMQVTVEGQSVKLPALPATTTPQARLGQVVAAINAVTPDTGMTAYLESASNGDIQLVLLGTKVHGFPIQASAVELMGFETRTTGVDSGGVGATYDSYVLELHGLQQDVESMVPGHMQMHPVPSSPVSLAQAQQFRSQVLQAYENYLSGYTVAGFELERNANGAAVFKDPSMWDDGRYGADIVPIANAFFSTQDANRFTNNLVSGNFSNNVGHEIRDLLEANFAQFIGNTFNSSEASRLSMWALSQSYLDNGPVPDAAQTPVDPANPSSGGAGIRVEDVQSGRVLANVNISTQAGSWRALRVLDRCLDQINTARAYLGAMQTRFEVVVENIQVQSENLSAARGRIVDADYAHETAALSRTQILQQAGTAMVAQANQLPAQVLQLLK